MTSDRNKAARDLLVFYSEAGVDALIGETPLDRFADVAGPLPSPAGARSEGEAVRAEVRPTERPSTFPAGTALGDVTLPPKGTVKIPASAPPPLAPDTALMAAREAARNAASLDELRTILDGFTGCALRATATQLVFADGNPQARLMFVGEAPGRDEDIEGLPFVGRSGKLLDLMFAAIGLDRTSVYIANIVPWRPPGNRTPTPQESSICLPFTLRQIELCDPDVLVCLGNPSTQTLLGTKEGITRTRGRWFPFHTGKREIRAIPTYHPAFLLRSPLQKRLAWRDFLTIKKELAKPSGR
jgi:uracil-DNA glycosylase family 4